MLDLFWITLSMVLGSGGFLAVIAALLVLDDRRTSALYRETWERIEHQHQKQDLFPTYRSIQP